MRTLLTVNICLMCHMQVLWLEGNQIGDAGLMPEIQNHGFSLWLYVVREYHPCAQTYGSICIFVPRRMHEQVSLCPHACGAERQMQICAHMCVQRRMYRYNICVHICLWKMDR